MDKIIIAGCGTEVGKTVSAAIITTLLQGDYWKPVQCGEEEHSDTAVMRGLLDPANHRIHPPAYSLIAPISPHHAARLEGKTIDLEAIILPRTSRPLVIETAGGIFSPLSNSLHNLDLFKTWNGHWIVVSKHYLGSINHTLLTLNTLKSHQISVAGIIFNGEPNADSEAAILEISKVSCLGRLLPEPIININTIQRYAKQWQRQFPPLIP